MVHFDLCYMNFSVALKYLYVSVGWILYTCDLYNWVILK